MAADIYSIDADQAVHAARALQQIIRTPFEAAAHIRTCDAGGAQLEPLSSSATVILDEVVQELGLLAELMRLRAELARSADEFNPGGNDAIQAVLNRFDESLATLVSSLGDAIGTDRVPFEPRDDWTPADVRAWWDGLSPDEQGQLRLLQASLVGNTDGVPIDDRIRANNHAMQEMVDLGDYDERLQQFIDPLTGRIDNTRQIILFDPTSDGFAAELFGDLETATSVAVLVPGMGSELGNFSKFVGEDARTLRGADGDMAVIAWTGYDAPDGLPKLSSYEVATDGKAATGALQLRDFVAAVGLDTDAPLTVVGHSYGSLTVGMAIMNGLTADRVVFIGSPGVGVDNVRDFPAGAVGEYFAGEVHGDPVAALERFGDSPTDPDFGAHVYNAGNADSIWPLGRHSEYFDNGTALDNMRTIVTGGDPSNDRSAVIDYAIEPLEDLHDGWNDILDITEGVPFVDTAVDAVQVVINVPVNVAQTVVELGGVAIEDVVVAGGGMVIDGGKWVGGKFIDGVGSTVDSIVDGFNPMNWRP